MSEENDDLRKKLAEILQELDAKNQSLYSYQRQLKTAEILEKEYQQEIEELQNGDRNECKKLQAKIHLLEEELVRSSETFSQQLQIMEVVVTEKNQEIEQLQKDLQIVTTNIPVVSSDEHEKLKNDYAKLNSEIIKLNETIDEMGVRIGDHEALNITLEEKLNFLKDELDMTKELLESKRAELDEANGLIQVLQEDLAFAKTELDSLRAKPLDEESKGNSLFAEVEDKRVQMRKRLLYMKIRYNEIKQEADNYLKQVTKLNSQNKTILEQWKADINQHEKDDEMLLNNLSSRIKVLETLNEQYKNDIKPSEQVFDDEYKFFDNMLKLKNEEMEDLRQSLNTQSLSNSLLARKLCEANREIEKWRQEALELKSGYENLRLEIDQLKSIKTHEDDTIESIEEVDVNIIESKLPKLKSVIKNANSPVTNELMFKKPLQPIPSLSSENAKESKHSFENAGKDVKKHVMFTEDNSFNKSDMNSVTHRKRGCKVSISKPVLMCSRNS